MTRPRLYQSHIGGATSSIRNSSGCALTALLLFSMQSAPLSAQSATIVPNAVNKPTLNYLPHQRAALLFGGYSQSAVLDETWLLRNSCWQRLHIAAPPARAAHAAAYDIARSQLVMFGGSSANNAALGDTWVFDGTAWQQRHVVGPPARSTHRMTYDSANRRVLLFGGRNVAAGVQFGDTWSWDGTRWTELTSGVLPARYEAALTYQTSGGFAVLFGGSGAVARDSVARVLGDTWTLRGNVWSELPGPQPHPRDHHAMAYHQKRGVTVLFGGARNGMLGDTWLFDGRQWRQQNERSGPAARGGVPAATYDSDRDKVLMYGGWGDNGALQDLWEWDGNWSRADACR